jgi:glucosamine-6-phosphate deaminase
VSKITYHNIHLFIHPFIHSLKTHISPTYDTLSREAADFIADHVRQKPASFICVTSGDSPNGTYRYLADYVQAGKVDFSQCRFVGLDEWMGMGPDHEGSCSHQLLTHFFGPAQIRPEQYLLFDATAPDMEAQCERMNRFIEQHGPLDLMLVGIGVNGHIGLNEPGVSFDQYAHVSELHPITKAVGQKYFQRETPLEKGVTLGLQHLQDAKVAVLFANGEKKTKIVAAALEGEVTNEVPASILQKHPNAHIFMDEAAAAGLKKGKI